MKLLVLALAFSLTIFAAAPSQAQEVIVLVPGFFNSFTPEYFSETVISSFTERGFKVYVANNLNPIGTIEDNGTRLFHFFESVEKAEGHHVAFNVLAHSAGGLYTLFVADKQKFTIKNLITVSTPYKGVEFVQRWLENSALFRGLTDLAHLDGLVQLAPKGVAEFTAKIRVSPNMKIIAFGGFQEKSLDIWNARYLSLPFRVTSLSISEASDGIVGFSSSIGLGNIKTTENRPARQFRNAAFTVSLEHWEQTLDSNSFILLGIRNPGYIQREQQRFYSGIANYLLTLL